MKVRDYVRFKTLSREIKIGKVIDIIAPDKNSVKKYCVYDLDNNEATVDDYVIKSSPNIIDLIEAGDVIKLEYNGNEYICDVYEYKGKANCLVVYCEDTIIPVKTTDESVELKSVVTKEMYSSVEYRVESN